MATRRTEQFLEGNLVKYVEIHHPPAFTAQEVAAATHISGKRLAKTVIVKLDARPALAVVPADRSVQLDLLRRAAGAFRAELADPDELEEEFDGCDVGAVPPFGIMFGMETYVDRELANVECIAFNAGTHTDVIAIDFADYVRVVKPKLARIASIANPMAASSSMSI
jgi:Ala-tRNA(Pro) deacylase